MIEKLLGEKGKKMGVIKKGLIFIIAAACIISTVSMTNQLKKLGTALKESQQSEQPQEPVWTGEEKKIADCLKNFSSSYNEGDLSGVLDCMHQSMGGGLGNGMELISEVSEIFDFCIPNFFNIFKISTELINDEDLLSLFISKIEIRDTRAVSTTAMKYSYYNGLYEQNIPLYFLCEKEGEDWRIMGMLEQENVNSMAQIQQFLNEGLF